MSVTPTLIQLADRAEAGSGADRQLDRAIAHEIGETRNQEQAWKDGWPPRWTSSLDAVVTLIEERLPGWTWNISRLWEREHGYWWNAKITPDEAGPSFLSSALSEPRCRLACILRALAQQSKAEQKEPSP